MAKAKKILEQNVLSVESIPIVVIFPCKDQPRKTFKEESIKELADSMEANGLLLPIIIRPDGVTSFYEIVAGERRYRAAKLLEWETIPAIIKKVTDEEMLEIQVLENLQREDMSPLDEAAAFQSLLKKETIDWLSSKIHKSKKYVLDRIKLNDLCMEAKLYLATGVLPLGHAVLLSKISEGDQEKILKGIITTPYNEAGEKDNSLSYCFKTLSDLKSLISNTFTSFTSAPFSLSSSELIDGVPSCNDCEKRTCNQNLLFGDITKDDVCTDTVCFKNKLKAHVDEKVEEAKFKYVGVQTGESDAYCGSSIKVKGQTLYYEDKKKEGYTPVVITKADNWRQKDLGKTVWVKMPEKEEIEKAKVEKQSSGNSITWEQRQKQKFDTVIQPRIKVMAEYYNSKNFNTSRGFLWQLIFHYFKGLGDNELAAMLVELGALSLENTEFETIDNLEQEVIYEALMDFVINNKNKTEMYNTEMLAALALLLNKVEDTSEEDSEEFEEPSWKEITEKLNISK